MVDPALQDLAWLVRQLCRQAVHHPQDDGGLVTVVPYLTITRLERFLDDYDAGRRPTRWMKVHEREPRHDE